MKGRKLGFKSIWNISKNSQPAQNEEIRIFFNEGKLRRLWDISKSVNIQIIGLPEREEEKQEIENLFENIMKENYPSSAEQIYI